MNIHKNNLLLTVLVFLCCIFFSNKALANPTIAAEDLPDFEGMVGHSNECFGVGIIYFLAT